jgi:hypothetical protein
MPSIFDYIALHKHHPHGRRIPWIDQREGQKLCWIEGSVLALNVPTQGASGRGHLVIAESFTAAFITASGVCWEIGPLTLTTSDIHETHDGYWQFFLDKPIGLHFTFHKKEVEQLMAILQEKRWQPNNDQSRKENKVGIFGTGKAGDKPPKIEYPRGLAPAPGIEETSYLVSQALGKSGSSEIPKEDLSSYMAASYAHQLGIPEGDIILAWGAAAIRTPEDQREYQGTVVTTRNSMLAFWQPGRTSLIHTFQANHSAATDQQWIGTYSLGAIWNVAEYANNDDKFIVGKAPVVLTAHFGKDPHANRRSLTWLHTLAVLINLSDSD